MAKGDNAARDSAEPSAQPITLQYARADLRARARRRAATRHLLTQALIGFSATLFFSCLVLVTAFVIRRVCFGRPLGL